MSGQEAIAIDKSKLEEVRHFFNETILGWMIGDLRRSVEANTNFLTALGCLTYTEAVGVFLPRLHEEPKSSLEQKRFYRCLFRLKSEEGLRKLDESTKRETGKGIYQQLRHSGAHSYFFSIAKHTKDGKFFYPVGVSRDGKLADGTKSSPLGFATDDGSLIIATANYVAELEEAAQDFLDRICVRQDPEWVEAGIEGIDFMRRGIRPRRNP